MLIFKSFKHYYFSAFIPLFTFPTVLFPLQLIFNIYVNLLYLILFNFEFLLFIFFLSSLFLTIFVSFAFIALFTNWYLHLILFSSLCFS